MTISSLEIGQVLSCDVQIASGRRLFSRGHIITDRTLRVLKIWGVQHVSVYGASNDSASNLGDDDHSRPVCIADSAAALRMLSRQSKAGMFPVSSLVEDCIRLANVAGRGEDGLLPPCCEQTRSRLQLPDSQDVADTIVNDIQSYFEGFPKEYFLFVKMLNDVYTTPEAVVAVIEKNERLRDKILRTCESFINVAGCEIKSVYSCTAFLGSRTVLYFAIVLVYLEYLYDLNSSDAVVHAAKSALATGVAARYIAITAGASSKDSFFSNGILRDVGRLFFVRNFPSEYDEARRTAAQNNLDICTAETLHLGMTHAEVGGRILKALGFPAAAEKSVLEHHLHFSKVGTKEYAIMQVAAFVTKTLFYNPEFDALPPSVDDDAWAMLNITEESLSDVVKVIYLKSNEIIRLVYGE